VNTVTLGVDTEDAVSARFVAAMKGEAQGSFITFATPELLLQTLTQMRWEILKELTGAGKLSLREVARRVGRDVRRVSDDVHALLDVGVLERDATGAIEFPYDAVHVDFTLQRDPIAA
jgi:predicted transcriptional regulator